MSDELLFEASIDSLTENSEIIASSDAERKILKRSIAVIRGKDFLRTIKIRVMNSVFHLDEMNGCRNPIILSTQFVSGPNRTLVAAAIALAKTIKFFPSLEGNRSEASQ